MLCLHAHRLSKSEARRRDVIRWWGTGELKKESGVDSQLALRIRSSSREGSAIYKIPGGSTLHTHTTAWPTAIEFSNDAQNATKLDFLLFSILQHSDIMDSLPQVVSGMPSTLITDSSFRCHKQHRGPPALP